MNVNGLRLHYLDWGGEGPALVFLAGLGCSAHIFDQFAPRFVDRFRVVALTRRGHGESDYPETGYDLGTLTEDVRQFMDSLGIDKAIFAGHSMANMELCHFSALYPARVLGLIFLDAAYDRTKFEVLRQKDPLRDFQPPPEDHFTIEDYIAYTKRIRPDLADIWSKLLDEETLYTVVTNADGKIVDKMSDEIGNALRTNLGPYAPEDSEIRAPVLSIYSIWDDYRFPDYLTEEQRKLSLEFAKTVQLQVQRECIEQFRRDVPHARIVEIPKGHHYCFIKQEELVFDEMRKFLID